MNAGEIVVIRGAKGAGKSIVAEALTNEMLKQGRDVSRFMWDAAITSKKERKSLLQDMKREAARGRCVIVEVGTCDAPQINADRFIDIRFGKHERGES